MSPQTSRWRTNNLAARRDQHLMGHMVRRPSSRGSEGSYESTSPTSYPTLPRLSPGNMGTPEGVYHHVTPGADPLSVPYFTFRPEHHRLFHPHQRQETLETVLRRQETQDVKPLRKEVSRPRPCYPGQENTNTLNMMVKRESPLSSPSEKTYSAEPMETENSMKQRTRAMEELKQETVIAAGRIAIARCAGFNNAMELGRYVTVAMDTSYKIASLAIFLYQNARMTPRQVPVRTIQ